MNMRKIVVWLAALFASGCAGTIMPRWNDPGNERYQRLQAQRFDPYPEPDIGPEVVGGRPRGYEQPASLPKRSRQWQNPWQQPVYLP